MNPGPVVHPATRVVVLGLTALAREGGWVCTRDLAEAMGCDRTVARRTARELAARDWVHGRTTDPDPTHQARGAGGEWWRVGPRVLDVGTRYLTLLEAAAADLELRTQRALTPPRTTPPPRPSAPAGVSGAVVAAFHHGSAVHHQATALVLNVLEVLLALDGDWASAARLAQLADIHRQTTGDVLAELVAWEWVESRTWEDVAIYRVSDGVARLSARPAPRLASPSTRPSPPPFGSPA